MIPIGWALTIAGIVIDAFTSFHTSRITGLIVVGPFFTILAIVWTIQEFRRHRKVDRASDDEDPLA